MIINQPFNKGNNCPFFYTQGRLTFYFSIAPYTITLFFFLIFSILLYRFIRGLGHSGGSPPPSPPPIVRWHHKRKAWASPAIAHYGGYLLTAMLPNGRRKYVRQYGTYFIGPIGMPIFFIRMIRYGGDGLHLVPAPPSDVPPGIIHRDLQHPWWTGVWARLGHPGGTYWRF